MRLRTHLALRSSDLWEDAHERSDELEETDWVGSDGTTSHGSPTHNPSCRTSVEAVAGRRRERGRVDVIPIEMERGRSSRSGSRWREVIGSLALRGESHWTLNGPDPVKGEKDHVAQGLCKQQKLDQPVAPSTCISLASTTQA